MSCVRVWLGDKKLSFSAIIGKTIAENLSFNNCFIALPCMGAKGCGKCKVIASGELSEPNAYEQAVLKDSELKEGYRLACSAFVLGDITVSLEEDLIKNKPEIEIKLEENVKTAICVDLGTTNIEIARVALNKDKENTVVSLKYKNPLRSYGADVITRAQCSIDGKREEIKKVLCGDLNESIKSMCAKNIQKIIIGGNTTMLSLLNGTDCEGLIEFPFSPKSLFGLTVKAGDIGLEPKTAEVYFPNCVSAFVGADLVSACFGCDFLSGDETVKLLMDIGTNGEIILKKGRKFYATATAMGSAFEGSHIKNGVNAVSGAIYKAEIESNNLKVYTIGNEKPKGICAGGAVDILSCLKNLNIVDRTGLLNKNNKNVEKLSDCTAYKIENTDIYFTQIDIRNIQQAKSALCAGVKSLLKYTLTDIEELDEVIITGSFGKNLNVNSAINIGFLPSGFSGVKCSVYENLALKGLIRLSQEELLKDKITEFARNVESINLSDYEYFNEMYIECMYIKEL